MPCWISPRSRPSSSWSLTDRPGWLTLRARGATLDRPDATIVGRRQQHHNCRAVTHLDVGSGRAGLTIRIDEAHHYDLEAEGGTVRVVARIGPLRQTVAERAILTGPVTLAIATRTHPVLPPTVTTMGDAGHAPTGVRPAGPDTISFEIVIDERKITLAELDGRYLSTEVASGFTGRIIGMYVTNGEAAFDWLHYESVSLPDEPKS